MQFGLINTLATFQKQINNVLGEYLDKFIIAYLNNIIVYLKSKEEHREHVKWVLKRLQEEQMLVVIKKYKFFIRKTNFIGFIIKPGKISMDPKKVKAIVSQQEPENVMQLKLFLGFYNYYRRFIAQWLKSIKPFIKLIKKEKPQVQGSKQKELFQELKELFT